MSETALDRVARALDLIPFLSKNPGCSVVELAVLFRSTPAQISKDLSLLHMCGLPGYSHLELLDIDFEDPKYVAVRDAQVLNRPRTLSQVEVLTLVLGLQMLGELASSESEESEIAALQERLSGILSDDISHSITVIDGVVDSPLAKEISSAIIRSQFLRIKYNSTASDTISEKKLFPLDVYFHDGLGYLVAHDVDLKEVRRYRLDRIMKMEISEIDLQFRESIDSSPEESGSIDIELTMGRDGMFFIEKHNEIVTSFQETEDGFRVHLKVGLGEWIIRTLLAWGSRITVEGPKSLATILESRIAGTLANYQ